MNKRIEYKWKRQDKFDENKKELENELNDMKGVSIKLSQEELFLLETIFDSRLFWLQNEACKAKAKEELDLIVKKARKYMRICTKASLAYQYSKLKNEEKRPIGKRLYGFRSIKKQPYYVRDAERQFVKLKQVGVDE
tara:strand:+ start:779 stop:1189 length:411 start_codon:yes stop_codon:yes gene_type:complete